MQVKVNRLQEYSLQVGQKIIINKIESMRLHASTNNAVTCNDLAIYYDVNKFTYLESMVSVKEVGLTCFTNNTESNNSIYEDEVSVEIKTITALFNIATLTNMPPPTLLHHYTYLCQV